MLGAHWMLHTKIRLQCGPSWYDHGVSTVLYWVIALCPTTPDSLAYLCHHTTRTETITIIMILLLLLFVQAVQSVLIHAIVVIPVGQVAQSVFQ